MHITNGDAAVDRLRAAGVPGDVIPWRDVLHEGPVPAGLSVAELREVRARFLSAQGWTSYLDALADLAERDAAVDQASERDGTVLWFEHDLYDQLQLIQVLDRIGEREPSPESLTIVIANEYLGRQTPERMRALFGQRQPVSPEMLGAARVAWRAFTSPDPRAIEAVLADERRPQPLPFLLPALRRHLEEFPWAGNGLSRSERQALEVIAAGASSLGEAFVAAHHAREDPVFLGDTVFASYLERLGRGPEPLVVGEEGAAIVPPGSEDDARAFWKRRGRLTPAGRAVLDGWRDWIALAQPVRWLGGVELRGSQTPWRWNPETASLTTDRGTGRG
jgi:hypothetical protein